MGRKVANAIQLDRMPCADCHKEDKTESPTIPFTAKHRRSFQTGGMSFLEGVSSTEYLDVEFTELGQTCQGNYSNGEQDQLEP